VRAEESEDPLVGVVGPSSGTAILNNCHVDVTNTGAGNGYGIQAGAGMVMVWNSWAEGNATGGGSGYGIFATEGFVEVYGGSLAGTTARVFGVGGGTETIRNATAASIKSLSLWNGSSNDSPPANWETVAYNDAAWTAASAKSDWAVVITGADTFWTSDTGAGKRSLFRDSFTLSLTDVVSAILYWDGDDACEGIYVNGTLMDSWPIGIIGDDHGVREIDVSGELNFSGDNVIALSSTNTFDTVPAVGGSLVFKLIVLTGDGTILVHAAEGTVAPTEEPMWGDRAAWDVDDYGARHASDIHDAVSLNHLPTPTNQSADAGKAVVLNPTASAYVLGEEGSAAGGSFEVAITDVSNPPTEAQLITAFGPPDEFAGLGILNDNAADNNVYAVFSDLGHYWILPLAKAVVAAPNVAVAATTILAEDAGQWFGRAALELLPNGTWVLLYREAPAHADNGVDVLHIKFSDDEGETWTAEDTDLNGSAVAGFPMTPPSGTIADSEGPGEPWLILAPNGTLILHMWSVEYGVTNEGTYQSISTDNGITWTTPAQINFTGIADDANVFTTDDHFVYNGVIYISARRYDDVTPTNSKSIFLKSTDNGATWVYVADISSFTTDTWECALEYIGNDTIIALLRDKAFLKTYKSVSTDMGVTWSALSDITSAFGAIMGRTRLSTRAHIKGQENWWLDSVLIAYGFEQVDSGLAHDRRNAIWISPDRGTTWSGPHYVAAEIEDAGYGDMLYAASRGEWVFISYQGTLAEADLVQYDLTITGI